MPRDAEVSADISVVIPTHQRKEAVLRAVSSAFAQTLLPREVIVVDDGSSDGTVEALRALTSPVPLLVLVHESNKGGPAARNTGIAAARGGWIAFLDSDDVWEPRRLELQFGRLTDAGSDYGAGYCSAVFVDEQGREIGLRRASLEGDLSRSLLGANEVGTTSGVVVRRDLLLRVGGFDETMPACQDWELWLRIAPLTHFACVTEPLIRYTVGRSGRITTNPRRRIAGHLAVYRKHLRAELRRDPAARARFAFTLGEVLLESGKPDWAARLFRIWHREQPFSLRRLSWLLLARAGVEAAGYRRIVQITRAVRSSLRRALQAKATTRRSALRVPRS